MLGDTIAAVATPRGEGALAIVRISGPEAFEIADKCFEGAKPPSQMQSHTVRYGRIVGETGCSLDRVLLTVLRGPRSSTGEDTVEISCHGGPLPSARVLDRILELGARLARPGEFTCRAVLNGRMDLVQAEGVLEVIRARTREGLDAALRQLEGRVSERYASLRERLDECRTHLECAIDFAEDVTPWSDERIRDSLGDVAGEVVRMLAQARAGRKLQDGVSVAIVGRPNAGKSTLFNELIGEDRVIVSHEPGTTRDVVAEWTSFGGIPARLADTAGMRQSASPVEQAAVERARRVESEADVVLFMLDASKVPTDEERSALLEYHPERAVLVLNKIDLDIRGEAECLAEDRPPGMPLARVSALKAEGLDDLRAEVGARVTRDVDPEAGISASMRQIDILRRTRDALSRSVEILSDGGRIELAAVELGEAVESLGEVAGLTSPEEILEQIFSRFCIGK